MSLNKFDRPIQKDFSWKTAELRVPTLDYEMLNSVAMEQQAQYDNIASLKALVPRALPWNQSDLAIQQKYRETSDQDTADVSNAYIASPQAGAMAYRNMKAKIQKAWQPGGEADMLNKRYDAYYAGRKAIDDYYKDEVNPAFKQFAYDQLEQQSKSDNKYNPVTGEYQSIATPELFKNPDLRDKITKMIHEIDDSGDTQFLGPDKAHWIQKIQSSGKAADKIQAATEALMSQPEFSNQLKIENWYQNRNGQGAERVKSYIADMTNKNLQMQEDAKKAESGVGTKDFQTLLVQQGYDVPVNGVYDEKTKKASQDFLEKQQLQIEKNKNTPGLEDIVGKKALEKSYVDYALGFANQKISKDLIFDKNYEINVKAASDRARTNAMLQLNDRLAPVVDPNVLAAPSAATNLSSTFDMLGRAKESKTSLEDLMNNSLTKNPNSVFNGWTLNNVGEAQRLFNELPTAENGKNLTEEQRFSLFQNRLAENSGYKFSPEEAAGIYKGLVHNPSINQNFTELAKTDRSIEMINENTTQIANQYITTDEGKRAIADLRKSGVVPSGYLNLSDAQLAQKVVSDPGAFTVESDNFSRSHGSKNAISNSFVEQMKKDVKVNKAGIDYKTNNSYAIHAGEKDDFLNPVFKLAVEALNTQDINNFSSEGKAGLVIRNDKGEVDDGAKPKFDKAYVDIGADGTPILVVSGKVGEGKDAKILKTNVDLNSRNPITYAVRTGLEKNLANAVATGRNDLVEVIAKSLVQFDPTYLGNLKLEKEAPLTNLKAEDIVMERVDGMTSTTTNEGFATRPLSTKQVGGRTYTTRIGMDKTGNRVYFNTTKQIDKNGNPTGKMVVVPLMNGQQFTTDPGDINTSNMGIEVVSRTPVERKITKIPSGVISEITNSNE